MTDNNTQLKSYDNPHNPDNDLYIWDSTRLLNATESVNGRWYSNASYDKNHVLDTALDHLSSTRIATDTRKIQAGDIFLALSGANFDGHDYIDTATQKGAVATIVSRPDHLVDIPQLIVNDTRLALGQLAAYRRCQHPNLQVIALTGSSGKTSVKEMLRSIFAPLAPTLVTRGNLNNDLGVPMMLLELKDSHRYAILELGANHVGEIAYTTKITMPDVACILNIGTAHLGEFGGRDNIAKTKSEIYQTLTGTDTSSQISDASNHTVGTAIIPLDDDYFYDLFEQASKYTDNIIGFGLKNNITANVKSLHSRIYATEVHTDSKHNTFNLHIKNNVHVNDKLNSRHAVKPINQQNYYKHIDLPLAGQHNISNALSAAACAHALGIKLSDISAGLHNAKPAKGRLEWINFTPHRIIDDTYNANPHSVRVAVDVLANQPDYRVLILGDIGELGTAAKYEHQQLGQYIAGKFIDCLLCVGIYAEDTVGVAINAGIHEAYAFDDKADLLQQLKMIITNQESSGQTCTLLFKGSRSMAMETLITDLIK